MWALNYDGDMGNKIKEALEITTFILASEIANYYMIDRLKILSSRDMLTGVFNRNEMNNLVDELCRSDEQIPSVGVVFADLNGLKTINDTEGHPAGDKLLKDAADVLREVFDEDQIFRAGGDEFSIFLRGVSEAEVADKVEQIRDVSKRYDSVVYAIGYYVEKDGRNVRSALRLADERMYEDKKIYYEKNPDKKRVVHDMINMTQ